MHTSLRRWILVAVVLVAVLPLIFAQEDGPKKVQTQEYVGKVVRLDTWLKNKGVALDSDAAKYWLALITDDGKVYPLIKDMNTRKFFSDKRLLGRPVKLKAVRIEGTSFLRVMAVRTMIKGVSHDVYYWCDVCAIRREEDNDCECCGGPMRLREDPVKK